MLSITGQSNIYYSYSFLFLSYLHLRLLQLHSSWTAIVWTEGRGGWWESEFLGCRMLHCGASSFYCTCFFSTSALAWEKGSVGTVWYLPGLVVLHLNRRHPADGHASVSPWRQAEWHTHRGFGRCLAFHPHTEPSASLSSHHTETPGAHMLPLCSRTCQCSVKLRVKFSVCVLESSIYWLPGDSVVSS